MNRLTINAEIISVKHAGAWRNISLKAPGFVRKPLLQADISPGKLVAQWDELGLKKGDMVKLTGSFSINHPHKAGYPSCLKLRIEKMTDVDQSPTMYTFSGTVINKFPTAGKQWAYAVNVPRDMRFAQSLDTTVLAVSTQDYRVGDQVELNGNLELRNFGPDAPVVDKAIAPYTLVSLVRDQTTLADFA